VPDVTVYQVTFSSNIDLSRPNQYSATQLSVATEFSPVTAVGVTDSGNFHIVALDLNSITPTFTGFVNNDVNSEPDLTAGLINIIYFWKAGVTYYYMYGTAYTGVIDDTTPPVMSDVAISNIAQIVAQINATSNEGSTFYWGVYANGATAPTYAQLIVGAGSISYGNTALTANVAGNDQLTGLVYSTAYDVYYAAKDNSDNHTEPVLIEFSTIARTQLTAPVVAVASAGQTQLNVSVNVNASGVELYMSTTSEGTYTLYETLTASDLTASPVTGLTQGTTRYFKAIALGDDTTTVDSTLSIEYSGTTSTVTQLNAVTGLSSTPNSPTQNTLNWTDTNTSPNETYFRVRRSVNSDMSGATILISTLAANSTQYVDTTASAGQLYYYDVMCVGDGSTTSDSNTAVISCQTIVSYPTVSSAATSTDGISVEVIYSKIMPASPTYSGISFSGTTSGSHLATGATRDGSNTSKVIYTIGAALVNGETVTMAYTAGNVVSDDGGVLQNFSEQAVTNNVVATGTILTYAAMTNCVKTGNNLVATSGAGGGTWDAYALANENLTGDGSIEITLSSPVYSAMIGVTTVNTNTKYTSWTYGAFVNGGSPITIYRLVSGNVTVLTGTTPIANDKIRLTRVGTTLKIELYHNFIWSDYYTLTTSSTGTLYIHIGLPENNATAYSSTKY